MERLDMNEPIVEVIGLAHGEFVKNGVTVRTELGDSLPPIQGDRVQLQQVMLNLVINAIQAMSDVRDSKRELHVTTGVVESGESVRDAARDTAQGRARRRRRSVSTTAWVWVYRSAGRSSKTTADGCGRVG
jgi:C4-dicarboxylate-specific signal transduction histidine kinase